MLRPPRRTPADPHRMARPVLPPARILVRSDRSRSTAAPRQPFFGSVSTICFCGSPLSVGCRFLHPMPPQSPGAADRPPRRSQTTHSRLMMRTTFGSFFRPWWRRSWMVSRPSPSASRIAACAKRLLTPARAAMASMHSPQAPLRAISSPTTRRTASCPAVKRLASAGGIGPEQASRRRRSMATDRSGARWRRLAGNSVTRGRAGCRRAPRPPVSHSCGHAASRPSPEPRHR